MSASNGLSEASRGVKVSGWAYVRFVMMHDWCYTRERGDEGARGPFGQ